MARRPLPQGPKEDCPACQGTGKVPRHGGLREKDCPQCGGRGWVVKQA